MHIKYYLTSFGTCVPVSDVCSAVYVPSPKMDKGPLDKIEVTCKDSKVHNFSSMIEIVDNKGKIFKKLAISLSSADYLMKEVLKLQTYENEKLNETEVDNVEHMEKLQNEIKNLKSEIENAKKQNFQYSNFVRKIKRMNSSGILDTKMVEYHINNLCFELKKLRVDLHILD